MPQPVDSALVADIVLIGRVVLVDDDPPRFANHRKDHAPQPLTEVAAELVRGGDRHARWDSREGFGFCAVDGVGWKSLGRPADADDERRVDSGHSDGRADVERDPRPLPGEASYAAL